MHGVMTMDEMTRRFNSEWVLVENPVTDEDLNVTSGTVLWHSPNRDEVYSKALEFRPKHSAVLYLGEIPEDLAIVL